MRIRLLLIATAIAIAGHITPATADGPSGITPVPCGNQTWEPVDPTFEALPGAKAYFGVAEMPATRSFPRATGARALPRPLCGQLYTSA
jgi:hypothetical protein